MARETPETRTPTSRTSSAQSRTAATAAANSRPNSSAFRSNAQRLSAGQRRTPSRPGSSALRSASPSKLGPVRPPSSRLSMRGGGGSRQPSARGRKLISQMSTVSFFDRAKIILCKPSEQRQPDELHMLEAWFRKKSKLFEKLKKDVLLDVVKHCEIQTVPKDYVIIQQGIIGDTEGDNCFYIILRGRVSIMVKDDADEDDDRAEMAAQFQTSAENTIEQDRSKFGHFVGNLSDGRTFGELALLNNNCVRSASILSDEMTDLIVISRELYNRSVAKIISQEYEEKLAFVNNCKLFSDWANKWKRNIALSIVRHKLSYDEVLVRQGDPADNLYFVTQGELKLVADPEQHKEQFSDFIKKSTGILEEDTTPTFPQGLVNYLSPKSRQAIRLKSASHLLMKDGKVSSAEHRENKLLMSPSAQRKKTATYRAGLRKYNICYLATGQMLGDVEFLTGLTRYHATAVCTKAQTVVMRLHQVQFNRFFRKKNPDTVTAMTRTLGLQMPRRMCSDVIHKNVPLIKYIIIRLDDLNGTVTMPRRPRDELEGALPHVDQHHGDHHHHHNHDRDAVSLPTRFSRAKSGVSTRSYPMSSRSYPRTGKISLHESLPRNISLNLPQMAPAMNTYLNTQVQHIIGSETNEDAEGGPNQRPATDGGVYSLAKHQKAQLPKSEFNQFPSARTGIFFKLMQVTQPNVDKEDLAIGQEEFSYLCQLRRRIARQLNSYYPFASLESFLKLDEDQRPKKDKRKRRAQQAKSAPQTRRKLSKSLPNIRGAMKGPKKQNRGVEDSDGEGSEEDFEMTRESRGGPKRTHVAFSMPPS